MTPDSVSCPRNPESPRRNVTGDHPTTRHTSPSTNECTSLWRSSGSIPPRSAAASTSAWPAQRCTPPQPGSATNGRVWTTPAVDDAVNTMIAAADKTLDADGLAAWLRAHTT
jgi:hypothetical protein